MKRGTLIETIPNWPGVPAERARIVKARRGCEAPGADWHLVQYQDGGRIYMHRDAFRVIDNRAE